MWYENITMIRKLLSLFLILVSSFVFAENYILLAVYEFLVDSKYRYQTLIKYDYEMISEGVIKSEVVTKSLRGVPPYLNIHSSQISFFDKSGNINFSRISFYHGKLSNELHFTNNGVQKVFDVSSLVWILSKEGLDGNVNIYYNGEVKNISLTNSTSGYVYGNNWMKVKKVSDLTLVDRFFLRGVVIGKFTNASVEGRLVDLKLISVSN